MNNEKIFILITMLLIVYIISFTYFIMKLIWLIEHVILGYLSTEMKISHDFMIEVRILSKRDTVYET